MELKETKGSGSLLFFVGLPRSGKSTLAKKWLNFDIGVNTDIIRLQDALSSYKPRAVVCADKIRLSLYGERFFYGGEPHVAAVKYTMIEALLSYGHDVLVDGTHTTVPSIKEMLYLDPDARYIFVDTSPDECKSRAIATAQPDLCPVIDRMNHSLNIVRDELNKNEGNPKFILDF